MFKSREKGVQIMLKLHIQNTFLRIKRRLTFNRCSRLILVVPKKTQAHHYCAK